MPYRDTSTGGQDDTTNYLYGYSFSIDSSKTVQSLTLPNNRNVVVLGAALAGPAAAGYTLSAGTANPTSVNPGGSSTATITVTPANGYTGSVTLSCSISPVVTGTNAPTCSFGSTSPVSVTNGAATATLTFTTVGPSAAMFGPSGMVYAVFLPISGLALLGLCVGSGRSRGKMLVSFLALSVLLAGVLVVPSCGGGQGSSENSGTPAGNYTITITGTDANGKTQSNATPPTVAINVS
jgi:hypothetical protein